MSHLCTRPTWYFVSECWARRSRALAQRVEARGGLHLISRCGNRKTRRRLRTLWVSSRAPGTLFTFAQAKLFAQAQPVASGRVAINITIRDSIRGFCFNCVLPIRVLLPMGRRAAGRNRRHIGPSVQCQGRSPAKCSGCDPLM